MVKLVFCLRRLPQLSLAEFQEYWLQKHGPLVRSHFADVRAAEGRSDLRLDRPAESHFLQRQRLKQIALDQPERRQVAKPLSGKQTAPQA